MNANLAFQDPKIHYPTLHPELNFRDYIAECKNLIEKNRIDLDSPNAAKMIEANSPFEWRPENADIKYGALLIHGLFDSPFLMRDIGKHLQSQGCLVRAILLPGHGTRPGALLNVDYKEWIKTVDYGIQSFAKEFEKIFIVGYSTGATLAINKALQNKKIAGLILLSPALKIRTQFDFAFNWHRIISWAWKRGAWFTRRKENDYAKYQSVPLNAPYQLHRLIREIDKLSTTHSIKCPMLFALSANDITVCAPAARKYFLQYSHPKDRMIYYTNHFENENNPKMIPRKSHYPEFNIKNFSHISIPVSPNNLHYGQNGDYIDASHIEEKKPIIYGSFEPSQIMLFDLLFKLKLTEYRRQVLTFNPDFEFLLEETSRFLTDHGIPQ